MDIEKIVREVTQELGGMAEGIECGGQSMVHAWEIPSHLEHSLLNADIALKKILEECSLARRYCVGAVCVAPYYVSAAADVLRGSGVKVGTAVGFPHGAISSAAKLADVRECIKNGAEEIDIAVNMLAVKSGNMADAREDFLQAVDVAQGKAAIKAVFEHSVYTDDEKRSVLEMVKSCGVEYVKIQNVLSGQPATTEQICFVKGIVGRNLKIKIDGGVKTLAKASELIAAGADRIGLTATIAIAQEAENR